jgi:hypothetical protein
MVADPPASQVKKRRQGSTTSTAMAATLQAMNRALRAPSSAADIALAPTYTY